MRVISLVKMTTRTWGEEKEKQIEESKKHKESGMVLLLLAKRHLCCDIYYTLAFVLGLLFFSYGKAILKPRLFDLEDKSPKAILILHLDVSLDVLWPLNLYIVTILINQNSRAFLFSCL